MNQISDDQGLIGKEGRTATGSNLALYSSITSLWSGAVGAQHALFAAYITGHSFLIAAVVLLFAMFVDKHSTILGLGVIIISMVGVILSLQMKMAWGRFVGRVSLMEWHLRQIEKDNDLYGLSHFTDWEKIKKEPEKNLPDPKRYEEPFWANWEVKFHKSWWAPRAKIVPYLTAIIYIFFLFLCFFLLFYHGSHSWPILTVTIYMSLILLCVAIFVWKISRS